MLLAECYFSAAGEIDNKGHVITISYEVKLLVNCTVHTYFIN